MRATLTNLSPLPREHWAVVTFSRALVANLGVECTLLCDNGARWRAVRGRTVGARTTYRVRANMGGSETMRWELIKDRKSVVKV